MGLLLDISIVVGIVVSELAAAAALLYFAFQIWRCTLAASKGGGSRRRKHASADDETYRIARAAYVTHRDRAGRGLIIAFLGIFIGIGLGFVGDRWGGWPDRIRTICEGVELCDN
jgi:hypothetical protein